MQVHLACPQTLLPVLPLLVHELQVEEEAKRLDAIDLLGKLFTLPGSDMDLEYSYLFEEFMRRCKDQKVIPTCQYAYDLTTVYTHCQRTRLHSTIFNNCFDCLAVLSTRIRTLIK